MSGGWSRAGCDRRFCRSAAAYAEALDEADVPLVARLQLVT